MADRFFFEHKQQGVDVLEEEVGVHKQADQELLESTRRLELAYDQAIIYARQLKEEVGERKRAEKRLQEARDALEVKVQQRTAELSKANARLKREIAERRQIEEALRIEKDNLVNMLNAMEDGVYISNDQCDIEYVNPALMKEFGPFQGKKCYDYFHSRTEACPWCRNQDVFAGRHVRWEWYSSKNQRTYDVIDTPVKRSDGSRSKLEILRDITVRKQMEEDKERLEAELQRTYKMEALGTLAGGIAREFYEVISIIIGNTELGLYELAQERSAQRNLEEVLKACMRAEDVVAQVLTFSRRGERKKRAVLVSAVLQEAISLLRATLPPTVEIREKIESPSVRVMADPTQIHQVLINLSINAAWAMRKEGGILEVSLADLDRDGDVADQYPHLDAGPYVRLTVSDTGHGIEPDIEGRIFDPYFTTKKPGEGTGMGLALVYGIVESYGGMITMESQVGKGSRFHVFLPKIERMGRPTTAASNHISMDHERILFVDNDQAMVDMGKHMLKSLGYRVVAKTSSVEALEAFRAEPEGFDLVITDQTMPHRTGDMLAKELLHIRPDIPVILCAARSEQITEEQAKAIGIKGLVAKPTVTRVMAEAIRNVLDQD